MVSFLFSYILNIPQKTTEVNNYFNYFAFSFLARHDAGPPCRRPIISRTASIAYNVRPMVKCTHLRSEHHRAVVRCTGLIPYSRNKRPLVRSVVATTDARSSTVPGLNAALPRGGNQRHSSTLLKRPVTLPVLRERFLTIQYQPSISYNNG